MESDVPVADLSWACPKNLPPRVFVSNIPYDMQEEDLYAHFLEAGPILHLKELRSRNHLKRGMVFIQYETKEAADAAIEKFNHTKLGNREITVEYTTQEVSPIDQFHKSVEIRTRAKQEQEKGNRAKENDND